MAVTYVPQQTLDNDNWNTLFARYKDAFPAGTSVTTFVKEVVKANGIPYNTASIEAWIFGMSGQRLPFNARDNPGMYGGPKNVGYAFFRKGNVVNLPKLAQVVQQEAVSVPLKTEKSYLGLWLGLAGGALALMLLLGDDKKKKQS